MQEDAQRRRAWVNVSATALRANLKRVYDGVRPALRDRGPNATANTNTLGPCVPMVKSDAYGCSLPLVVSALEGEAHIGMWGVATLDEALDVRRLRPRDPILVCACVAPGCERVARAHDVTLTVSSLDTLGRLAHDQPYHLEIDTGMGRAGFSLHPDDGDAWYDTVVRDRRLRGVMTHMHSADDADRVREQWSRAHAFYQRLERDRQAAGVSEPVLLHVSNSLTALLHPQLPVDAVRPGIALYGGVDGTDAVVRICARVVHVRYARPGDTVGYGAMHTCPASGREHWATVAIGYGDGLRRCVGEERGWVGLHGRRCPIVGRVSMDVITVRVPDDVADQVCAGDVATVVGADEGGMSLQEAADLYESITYEVLTSMSPRLPRILVDNVYAGEW